MKITLEFESYQEMIAYCLKAVGPEVAPETPKAEKPAPKKQKKPTPPPVEEAPVEETSEETDGGTEVVVDVTLEDIEAEVDRIRKLGRAATLKIRKWLDEEGIDRIGDMEATDYPKLYNFLTGVTK